MTHPGFTRSLPAVLAATLCGVATLSAAAQTQADADADTRDTVATAVLQPLTDAGADDATARRVAALVADLDRDDYPTRRQAARALAEDEAFVTDHLEAVLRAPDLTLAQRLGVERAAWTRFVNSERGAIGIQFETNAQPPILGQRVAMAAPGFPAVERGQIQAGDLITHLDGQELAALLDEDDPLLTRGGFSRTMSDFTRASVFSRDPGDTVPAVIRRSPEVDPGDDLPPVEDWPRIETDLVLGALSGHGNAGVQPYILQRAWALRAEREGFTTPRPLEINIDPGEEGWLRDAKPMFGLRSIRDRLTTGPFGLTGDLRDLRSTFAQAEAELAAFRMTDAEIDKVEQNIVRLRLNNRRVVIAGQIKEEAVQSSADDVERARVTADEARLGGLARQLAHVDAEIARLSSRSSNASIEAGTRSVIDERLNDLMRQREAVEGQMTLLRARAKREMAR